jgi:hypothetical protein
VACTKGPYEEGTFCGFINPLDPCAPQPDGYGPVPTADTVAGFQSYQQFHSWANDAVSPASYKRVFVDLDGAIVADSYLGFYTLTSYSVDECAAKCDGNSLCTSFNIYIERDPQWNPWLCSCDSPPSMTNFKCSIYGSSIDSSLATNKGETREKFEVVIAGSNGYVKSSGSGSNDSNTNTVATTATAGAGTTSALTTATTAATTAQQSPAPTTTSRPGDASCPTMPAPPVPKGCKNLQRLKGIHNHPKKCVGKQFFPGPFNAELCGTMARSHNANLSKTSSSRCKSVNSFMVKQDGKPKGTYCNLFSETYEPSVGTDSIGWVGGTYYETESSYSFEVDDSVILT